MQRNAIVARQFIEGTAIIATVLKKLEPSPQLLPGLVPQWRAPTVSCLSAPPTANAMTTMTPRDREEYRALRATIRTRGTARIVVFAVGLGAWAAMAILT